MNTNKEMNDLKIGDRVKVISVLSRKAAFIDTMIIGRTGTVKELKKTFAGVEFDEYMGGHNGSWGGKQGYCWYVERECLEKIDETKEEVEEMDTKAKAETLEQKVFEVLRKEIGVGRGEEFDVYQNGVKQWTCKFEEGEFFQKVNYESCKSDVWIDIIYNFSSYTFEKKPFILECGTDYFFLSIRYNGNKNIKFRVLEDTWLGTTMDYGMLSLGNVFRNKAEALKNKDKLLEKLKKLQKGE